MSTAPAKAKAKPPTITAGVYKPEAIKDISESLGITQLSDAIAQALASDVEYRIQQVIEEAARFTRHSRRGTMTTSDVDEALKCLNIEPLYGHSAPHPPQFRRAQLQSHPTHPNQPHSTHLAQITQSSAAAQGNAVYFLEDEEIDFERVIREEKVFLPKSVSYTAHWLAVEGVQPLVPENPPALPKPTPGTTEDVKPSTDAKGLPTPPSDRAALTGLGLGGQSMMRSGSGIPVKQNLVKQVLSRELQLYFTRLTASLLTSVTSSSHPPPTPSQPSSSQNSDEKDAYTKRTAALASLQHDAGLQPLLPYLVRWVAEGVVTTLRNEAPTEADGATLEVFIMTLNALMRNESLFVEPYLHQILPSLLSTLLHSALPPSSSPAPSTHASTSPYTPTHLRSLAASVLASILRAHSITYPSLHTRVMKTLLIALLSSSPSSLNNASSTAGAEAGKEAKKDPSKDKDPTSTFGTREGALRALMSIGPEAVKKGLIEGGALKSLSAVIAAAPSRKTAGLASTIAEALVLIAPPTQGDDLEVIDITNVEDARIADKLREVAGEFGVVFLGDRSRAKLFLEEAGIRADIDRGEKGEKGDAVVDEDKNIDVEPGTAKRDEVKEMEF